MCVLASTFVPLWLHFAIKKSQKSTKRSTQTSIEISIDFFIDVWSIWAPFWASVWPSVGSLGPVLAPYNLSEEVLGPILGATSTFGGVPGGSGTLHGTKIDKCRPPKVENRPSPNQKSSSQMLKIDSRKVKKHIQNDKTNNIEDLSS